MRLTKLVPALGLIAAVAAPVSAIELADGTLSIGGDVTVTFAIEDDGDDTTLEWAAEANLNVGYRIGEDVTAYMSIDFDDTGAAIDEAYISWAFADNLSLTVGKYATWIGYQPMTINDSLTADFEGDADEIVGAAITFAQDDLEVTLHVVNGIWSGIPLTEEPMLAFALFAGYSLEGVGTLGGSVSYEPQADDDIVGINVFAELDQLVDGMIFGLDLSYIVNGSQTSGDFTGFVRDLEIELGLPPGSIGGGDIDVLTAMVYANYTLPTPFPASVTGAFSVIDWDGGEEQDFRVQLALLTNPTGNDNFELNFEFMYDIKNDLLYSDDEFGFFVEFVAVIP